MLNLSMNNFGFVPEMNFIVDFHFVFLHHPNFYLNRNQNILISQLSKTMHKTAHLRIMMGDNLKVVLAEF